MRTVQYSIINGFACNNINTIVRCFRLRHLIRNASSRCAPAWSARAYRAIQECLLNPDGLTWCTISKVRISDGVLLADESWAAYSRIMVHCHIVALAIDMRASWIGIALTCSDVMQYVIMAIVQVLWPQSQYVYMAIVHVIPDYTYDGQITFTMATVHVLWL